MNRIDDICKMFGVVKGEYFKLRNKDGIMIGGLILHFEDDGLLCNEESDPTYLINGYIHNSDYYFRQIATGEVDVVTFKQTSEKEHTLLEQLPKEYNWIVMDEHGLLQLYKEKPLKQYISTCYYWDDDEEKPTLFPYKHLFKCVKFTDNEATSINELLNLRK